MERQFQEVRLFFLHIIKDNRQKTGSPDKYRGSLLLDIMPHLCTHFTPYSEYLRLDYSGTEAKILE